MIELTGVIHVNLLQWNKKRRSFDCVGTEEHREPVKLFQRGKYMHVHLPCIKHRPWTTGRVEHNTIKARLRAQASAREHEDQFHTLWRDLYYYGDGGETLWLSTPTPETWERLHIWFKRSRGDNDVFTEFIALDEASAGRLCRWWQEAAGGGA